MVIGAIRRELSHEEFVTRLRRRRPVDLGRSAAEFLREARAERD